MCLGLREVEQQNWEEIKYFRIISFHLRCLGLGWEGCKVKTVRYTPHFIVSQRNLYFYLSVVVYLRMRVNEVELKKKTMNE